MKSLSQRLSKEVKGSKKRGSSRRGFGIWEKQNVVRRKQIKPTCHMLETAQVNISIFQGATELLTFISSARKKLMYLKFGPVCSEFTSLEQNPYYQIPIFIWPSAYNSVFPSTAQ